MPLFVSEEELERFGNNGRAIAEKADAFIRDLYKQLETVKAQADAAAITAEQTCSLLEQKYISLSSEFAALQSHNSQLNSSLEQRLSDLAQLQADKHQLSLKAIGKDGEIERLTTEASELHKSNRQLLELVNLTEKASLRERQLNDVEAELIRCQASCTRLLQEKELIERHNVWLNDELTAKVNHLLELRKKHGEYEAEMSAKLADVERQYNECSSSLNWNKERVRELELKLTSLQQELCLSKDTAAENEQRFSAEISTVAKLVDLYKESSEEWSKKAGELEGVIKALEKHLSQVENDYKEKLERELSARKEIEKVAAELKEKFEKCEAELEASRKANERNLLPLSCLTNEMISEYEANESMDNSSIIVPRIPAGVSGTALAASLLRDGWSLAKMYEKYQEAVDALRHEQLGRKQSQAILERVLYEIEEKAEVIINERAEHERVVEAYSAVNQKLRDSLSEQATLERTVLELKADLKRHQRNYGASQKEIKDLQKQVTILLKECQDLQLRGGSVGRDYDDGLPVPVVEIIEESDIDRLLSEKLLTFRDIHALVEQNVQLRSLTRSLSEQIEKRDTELKEKFEMELQKHTDDAASKVEAILQRAEEQGRMIESLHGSVAMYKRLYEEEVKLRSSFSREEPPSDSGRKDLLLLIEGSQVAAKNAQDQAAVRLRSLEEDLAKSKSEIIAVRSERDKLALEANFARERLDSLMKEFDHQRGETNNILARNVEFSQLVVDYQRRLRESSEALHAAEEISRKLTMQVSILKNEKEMLSNSEKRAYDEVRNLSERVQRLQASLDTIQIAEEVREEAKAAERRKQEEYIKKIEREWAEAKKELHEERDNVRALTLDRERTIMNAMKQVEELSKELADAMRAVAAAESKAAVAEARYADLDKKMKSSKGFEIEGTSGQSTSAGNEASKDFRITTDEIEKLKEDAQANKDHMLQYKRIAEANEGALKQMESAYENFKTEADKLKRSLEAELTSLRQRVSELEDQCCLKAIEAASATAGKEEALGSALTEIANLKDETAVKSSQITALEIQISALKEDLENEHQRWRTAQANYERQVILQSETIQELTKTSQALALLQDETSELRRLTDAYKTENLELKAKWDSEKSMLVDSKNEAEKKYNELNEQNKILHSRLEALHIKLAEKDSGFAISLGSTDQNSQDDVGLQNVINFLRRSKEIAETEISLLKQEKLRLQAQLDSALKASESAQAALNAERANARALLLTEEEIKSLKLQVSEMNLLRESNMQLREENKYNFEECQKLREIAQRARVETENLETRMTEVQIKLDASMKEAEMHRMEKEHMQRTVDELLLRCRNIDVEEYDRLKSDVQQLQITLRDKDSQNEEINKLASERQVRLAKLEHELESCKQELNEKENKINDLLQAQSILKSDVEKQKKMFVQLKKRSETLAKEKEELMKEKQVLSKQLEDSRLGKKSMVDAAGDQAMKEKEREKDTRIQILEKTLEREREELRKEKEDHKTEKAKRLKNERAVMDTVRNVHQERKKLVDEFEKHKVAVKKLSDELEKLKQASVNLPEGTLAIQALAGSALDGLANSFNQAVEHYEKVANTVFGELGTHASPADTSTVVEASTSQISSADDKEKRLTMPRAMGEPRKLGRRLMRPRIGKPEEPQGDTEMSEIEGSSDGGKLPPQDMETQGNLGTISQLTSRKRLTSSSTPEIPEESTIQPDMGSDDVTPSLKKVKVSDSQNKDAEGQSLLAENVENLPTVEEPVDAGGDSLQGPNEEAIEPEKDEAETIEEQNEEPSEPQNLVDNSQTELQNDRSNELEDNLDKTVETEVAFDDGPKDQEEQPIQQLNVESGSEREEGELLLDMVESDVADISSIMDSPGMVGGQSESLAAPAASPARVDEDTTVVATGEATEAPSPEVLNEDKNGEGETAEEMGECTDKLDEGNDQVLLETEPSEAISASESVSTSTTAEVTASKQGSSSSVKPESEAKQVSPASMPSRTINLNERARERAMLRQAGVIPQPTRGRGRVRGARGLRGRGGARGQSPNEQS
ncbi:Nucleoprotein TPR/MLP1 [Dillenia turbinata]|uniref:Nucleoprotein TPR/MLP1 n=1 Tax=Dillenia turbinata TaxID=194707 RepID=A0AAN8V070_9MAGN